MGVPYFNKKGVLVKYVEKPKKPPRDWAVPGLYFADGRIFRCFEGKKAIKPSGRGEYEITAAFQWLIDNGYRVKTREFTGVWRDPGKFDDWLDTNQFLLDTLLPKEVKNERHPGINIEGRVKIGKKCRISSSFLRGPLIIGDGVKIEDSFIGPYSSIGDDCLIRRAKIENTILVREVTIDGPSKPIDSSLIGEGTIIEGNRAPTKDLCLFLGNQCFLRV